MARPASFARPREPLGFRFRARSPFRVFCTAAFLFCCLITVGCGGALRPWSIGSRGNDPYLQLGEEDGGALRQAISTLESGDTAGASRVFVDLNTRVPGDLPSAVWLQEARLAERMRRAELFGFRSPDVRGPQADLRERYRAEALASPSALAYFLAARVEEDQLAASLLLRKALELDPRMAWAHYGMAHAAAREGDWTVAREELMTVFEIDPGHLPSVRLFGWLMANVGDDPSAVAAFEAWIKVAANDPLSGPSTLDRVRFDLVLAYTAQGSWRKALDLLDELEQSTIPASDRMASVAVARQGRGEVTEARKAALAGRRADREALLPAVQNALLIELWQKDKLAAQRAWREVIELASTTDDLAAGLQQFRAEVHLQRLEREAAQKP